MGSGRSKGVPPLGQNFLNFMQFFGKFGIPLKVGTPQGNPGSAPDWLITVTESFSQLNLDYTTSLVKIQIRSEATSHAIPDTVYLSCATCQGVHLSFKLL